MKLDKLTRDAISHTLHCLVGCGIGEVLGLTIATALGWHMVAQTALAIVLAFAFGYGLTYISFHRSGVTGMDAVKGTLATDTISITSMEIVDNGIMWLIPSAMAATLTMPIYWWSLALAMAVAFAVTVPVNRFLMSKGIGVHHGHHGHGGHAEHDTHTNHDHHDHEGHEGHGNHH